jgi:hypothetical protein
MGESTRHLPRKSSTVEAILVRAPRVPVHTGTTAMADRTSLTVHQNALQLTRRYGPHLCKAGPRHGTSCHSRATTGGQSRSTGVTRGHGRPQVKACTRAAL